LQDSTGAAGEGRARQANGRYSPEKQAPFSIGLVLATQELLFYHVHWSRFRIS
jgi:hypothetical protein